MNFDAFFRPLLVASAILLGSIGPVSVYSQNSLTSAFPYQGALTDNNIPATGTYDFIFTLYDASENGNAIGTPSTQNNVTVTNGLFTVPLDFGANAFNGERRWLETRVAHSTSWANTQPSYASP